MRNALSLLKLFFNEPLLHSFYALFILVSLLLCDNEQLFFDFTLSLSNQLPFQAFLGIFRFEPFLVREFMAVRRQIFNLGIDPYRCSRVFFFSLTVKAVEQNLAYTHSW